MKRRLAFEQSPLVVINEFEIILQVLLTRYDKSSIIKNSSMYEFLKTKEQVLNVGVMTMIYLTGDCHGDFHRFNTKNFPEQKKVDSAIKRNREDEDDTGTNQRNVKNNRI